MFYIPTPRSTPTVQITLEQILSGAVPSLPMPGRPVGDTITHRVEAVPDKLRRSVDADRALALLNGFNEATAHLRAVPRQSLYHSFKIPKKSGEFRQIDAPNDALKTALRRLRDIFMNDFGVLYHTAAFAYIPNRSIIDALKRHQANESYWFLKTDFSNFFGSTTKEFVLRMFAQIFPLSELMAFEPTRRALETAIELCFLNGGLPQGTPISPFLTNVVMIPFDYEITRALVPKRFVYTRYADDTLISHRCGFSQGDVNAQINDTLRALGAPYVLKPEKTRYGSRSGSNWNLGLMLNKDNNITFGHEVKKKMKARCHDYIMSKRDRSPWPVEEVRSFFGTLSYFDMVEPGYTEHVIEWFNKKYGVNMIEMMRADMRGFA